MSGRLPEVLLPEVIDYLDISNLLLSAMPVNRCWREQACAHPTYWRQLAYTARDGHIELLSDDIYDTQVARHEGSRDLFLLRLSRTHARPIDVTVRWADQHVLSALAPHLPHVRSLSVDALVRHWDSTVSTLRGTPAPLLESLSLLVRFQLLRDSDWEFHPYLPCDLFAGQPAALKEVQLCDVGLLSTAELPVCFADVESLVVHNTHANVHRPLPDVFRRCIRLKKLWIYCRVTLDDPAFLKEDNWRGLDELGLHVLASWDEIYTLPLANVPRIVISPWDVPTALEVVHWLGSRLTVEIPPLRPGIERGDYRYFHAEFGVFGDTLSRRRLIQMCFPGERNGSLTSNIIAVFQQAAVNERIIELTLSAHNWDLLVGMRYLTTFPALEHLVLTVSRARDAMPCARAADATLSCPRLARLVLRSSTGSDPLVITPADLCDFARTSLADAPFPIMLELHNVSLHGSPSDMGALFTQ